MKQVQDMVTYTVYINHQDADMSGCCVAIATRIGIYQMRCTAYKSCS